MSAPIVHGTSNAYGNRGCRCEACKEAWSVYQASRRVPCVGGCGQLVHARSSKGRRCRTCTGLRRRKPFVHGTELGYDKGCKCVECKAAAATARRGRKKTEKEENTMTTIRMDDGRDFTVTERASAVIADINAGTKFIRLIKEDELPIYINAEHIATVEEEGGE